MFQWSTNWLAQYVSNGYFEKPPTIKWWFGKITPLKRYPLIRMVMFQCHFSFQGRYTSHFFFWGGGLFHKPINKDSGSWTYQDLMVSCHDGGLWMLLRCVVFFSRCVVVFFSGWGKGVHKMVTVVEMFLPKSSQSNFTTFLCTKARLKHWKLQDPSVSPFHRVFP